MNVSISATLIPSDTKGFGTTSDTRGGGWAGGRADPSPLSHNSLDLGT